MEFQSIDFLLLSWKNKRKIKKKMKKICLINNETKQKRLEKKLIAHLI